MILLLGESCSTDFVFSHDVEKTDVLFKVIEVGRYFFRENSPGPKRP